MFAFVLEENYAALFQPGKSGVPEMKMEDFAFAREEIVFDVETIHGLEMAAQHGDGNEIGDGGGFVVSFLDGVEGLQTNLHILLVLGIPLRDSGVEVPAVVVEAGLADQLFDFFARLLFDIQKSHDHVGHLRAGVVDVVLDVHFPAGKFQ